MSTYCLQLDGVRVIDWTRFVASPYRASVLADNGADVIKPPDDDLTRRLTLAIKDAVDGGTGASVLRMNRATCGVTFDLRSADSRRSPMAH